MRLPWYLPEAERLVLAMLVRVGEVVNMDDFDIQALRKRKRSDGGVRLRCELSSYFATVVILEDPLNMDGEGSNVLANDAVA